MAMQLLQIDDHFIQTRLDSKYGQCEVPLTADGHAPPPPPTHALRFLSAPCDTNSAGTSVEYKPRPHTLDRRRRKLVDVYANATTLQDMRDVASVPVSLMHIARIGMRQITSHGVVRVRQEDVAIVSNREVGGLLKEVALHTPELSPAMCVRLVVDMCTKESVAREWLACFGD